MTMVISWQFSQILPRVPLTRPGGGVCFPLKSGVDFSKAEIFATRFCHEYVIAKGTGLSSACFFGWKNLEDQSVGSVFFGQHEITRITRISKGIFQKAGLTIQDFAEI